MKTRIVFLISLFVLAFGCTKDSTADLIPETKVAFDARFYGTFTVEESQTCTSNFLFTSLGEGVMSNLGFVRIETTWCSDAFGNPQANRKGIVETADGELMYCDVNSTPTEDGNYRFHYTINSGTGSFQGATGEFLLVTNIDFVNATWKSEGGGTIWY